MFRYQNLTTTISLLKPEESAEINGQVTCIFIALMIGLVEVYFFSLDALLLQYLLGITFIHLLSITLLSLYAYLCKRHSLDIRYPLLLLITTIMYSNLK